MRTMLTLSGTEDLAWAAGGVRGGAGTPGQRGLPLTRSEDRGHLWRWKGSFLMSSSVDFWYLLISRRATVAGR